MAGVRDPQRAHRWNMIDIGTAAVAVAQRDALGTTARVAAWPPHHLAGDRAAEWLAAQGLPARLVAHDGSVRLTGGWPTASGGLLEVPAACRMPAGVRGLPTVPGPIPGGLSAGPARPRGAR
jgi:hypothetical protein